MTGQVEELIAHLEGLTDDELRDLATTPEWALFMRRLCEATPGRRVDARAHRDGRTDLPAVARGH